MPATLAFKSAFFLMLALKALSMPSKKTTDPKIYLYEDTFEDNYCCKNVTPKDVGAFKFYCIQDHIVYKVAEYEYMFPVSDNLYEALLYMSSQAYMYNITGR